MGKISGKSLAEKYDNFQAPCVKVLADGKEILTGDGVYLERTEVISSVGMEPDMAVLFFRAGKLSKRDFTEAEKYWKVGQKMEVQAGYGDAVSRIFLGYLHEVEAVDFLQDSVEYTLVCLDVKGMMKKNSVLRTSGNGNTQQMLNDILGTECYGAWIEEKTVDTLPKEPAPEHIIKGETHYEWLCHLAARLNYEFFCGRGKTVFQRAQKAGAQTVELTEEYGLLEVRGVVTMAEQTGSIQVCGYNRRDEKVLGTAEWPGVSGPFGGKMKQALSGCTLTLLDMELETEEQAGKLAGAQMKRAAARGSYMRAVTAGIPELQPGICAEITDGGVTSLSGRIYVEEARHLLDERGYRTAIRGARL